MLFHIWSVWELRGKNIGKVIAYLVVRCIIWENIGKVNTYRVDRGATWKEYS